MRALVWHGPELMTVDELPDPEPTAGEVLIAPSAAGICGSELEGYLGKQVNRTPPLVMGHELAGRVVEVGAGVDDDWRGRDVAINPLIPGDDAIQGIEQLSERRELIGVHRPGGFATLVRAPVGRLRSLPAGTDPRLGVLAEPLANGVHAARIGRAGVEGGPVGQAAVLGAGTIGLMALQAMALGGADQVAVLEPNAERRAAAAALGASETFADEQEFLDAVGAVDIVLDAAGLEATRRLALRLLRPGGCAVLVGLAQDESPIGFHEVIRRGLTLRGAYAYTDDDYDEALRLLLEGSAGLGELEPVLPLEAGPEAFAELASGPSARLRVFLGGQ